MGKNRLGILPWQIPKMVYEIKEYIEKFNNGDERPDVILGAIDYGASKDAHKWIFPELLKCGLDNYIELYVLEQAAIEQNGIRPITRIISRLGRPINGIRYDEGAIFLALETTLRRTGKSAIGGLVYAAQNLEGLTETALISLIDYVGISNFTCLAKYKKWTGPKKFIQQNLPQYAELIKMISDHEPETAKKGLIGTILNCLAGLREEKQPPELKLRAEHEFIDIMQRLCPLGFAPDFRTMLKYLPDFDKTR